MTNFFISIFEKKSNRLVAFYYIPKKLPSENLIFSYSWLRAIDENKVSIKDRIDEYRFEISGKFPSS